MPKLQTLRRIREVGLIPVLRARKQEDAIAIAHAIREGGVPILEITMTVPGALEVIRELAATFSNQVLIGAGTVLDPETARACILAGAEFIVSPALKISTIEICHRYAVPIFPGALTPTEVLTAWEAGADAVKVFPCGAMGGAQYLKSLKAPLPQIEMIPTGGVSLSTAAEFFAAGAFALGVGADLIGSDIAGPEKLRTVTDSARKYVEIASKHRVLS
jgi:2-dehydro-3-deoxyphosphogluconate aldolase / (4S)-4-hydroxy-2-oxoglutarate aldolase